MPPRRRQTDDEHMGAKAHATTVMQTVRRLLDDKDIDDSKRMAEIIFATFPQKMPVDFPYGIMKDMGSKFRMMFNDDLMACKGYLLKMEDNLDTRDCSDIMKYCAAIGLTKIISNRLDLPRPHSTVTALHLERKIKERLWVLLGSKINKNDLEEVWGKSYNFRHFTGPTARADARAAAAANALSKPGSANIIVHVPEKEAEARSMEVALTYPEPESLPVPPPKLSKKTAQLNTTIMMHDLPEDADLMKELLAAAEDEELMEELMFYAEQAAIQEELAERAAIQNRAPVPVVVPSQQVERFACCVIS